MTYSIIISVILLVLTVFSVLSVLLRSLLLSPMSVNLVSESAHSGLPQKVWIKNTSILSFDVSQHQFELVDGELYYKLNPKIEVSIGRSKDNQIALNDTYVSRHHLRLVFEDNQWFVKDLSSVNGAYLNQKKLGKGEEKPLQIGDVITISDIVLVIV